MDFIRKQVTAAGASGVVFGLSGGVDSAVTAHLCSLALGSDKCLALIMPNTEFTPASETDDGILVATKLSVPYITVPIQSIVQASVAHDENPPKMASGNLNARLRAVLLYYEAQKRNYLVVGTDDKSEHMLGYFTKYGDGACDMLPIVSLYKTQVWDLARHLQVPHHIIEKEPGPHLWTDHLASDELGLSYAEIDKILQRLHDDPAKIPTDASIPLDKIHNILRLHHNSAHKRCLPPEAILNSDIHPHMINPTIHHRPWGKFEQFTLNVSSTVKILYLDPKASISLQYHKNRSEFWRVVFGSAVAFMDDTTSTISEGEDLFVPAGSIHKLTGGAKGAQILEIAMGEFSENDNTRLQDNWGRV